MFKNLKKPLYANAPRLEAVFDSKIIAELECRLDSCQTENTILEERINSLRSAFSIEIDTLRKSIKASAFKRR